MAITSENENIEAWKTPLRAISIMPPENVAPSSTPTAATPSTTLKGAMRLPTAEFRKLTASLLTPTKRSTAARIARNTSRTRKNVSIMVSDGSRNLLSEAGDQARQLPVFYLPIKNR